MVVVGVCVFVCVCYNLRHLSLLISNDCGEEEKRERDTKNQASTVETTDASQSSSSNTAHYKSLFSYTHCTQSLFGYRLCVSRYTGRFD